jgi:hypothetical protein
MARFSGFEFLKFLSELLGGSSLKRKKSLLSRPTCITNATTHFFLCIASLYLWVKNPFQKFEMYAKEEK